MSSSSKDICYEIEKIKDKLDAIDINNPAKFYNIDNVIDDSTFHATEEAIRKVESNVQRRD